MSSKPLQSRTPCEQVIHDWIDETQAKLPLELKDIPDWAWREAKEKRYDASYSQWESNPKVSELIKGGIPKTARIQNGGKSHKIERVHSVTLNGYFLVVVQYHSDENGVAVSDLFIRQAVGYKRLFHLESTREMDLIKPAKEAPVFIRASYCAGTAGVKDELYTLEKNGELTKITELWCWHGGYEFYDAGGSGWPLMVHFHGVEGCPDELGQVLEKKHCRRFDGLEISYCEILKWDGNIYKKIGEFYERNMD
jgi:hypothetical protein